MKIVTEHVYPPIPIRKFDWLAHYDDPEGPTGTGPTEQDAINDLLSNHPPCKDQPDQPHVRIDGGCLRCEADAGEACHDRNSIAAQKMRVYTIDEIEAERRATIVDPYFQPPQRNVIQVERQMAAARRTPNE